MPYIDSHSLHTNHLSPLMASEVEKPRVTEIKVRMDCNGCVQKIKKALHGITGICDIYVDFSEQKVTITGWAEPEKLVKAIRKTRKSAVICVHTEQSDQSEPPPEGETTPEEGAPPPPETPPDPTNPLAEPPQTEAEPPDKPPQPENPPPATSQTHQPPRSNDIEGVQIVYHHPSDHGYQHPYGPNHQQGHNGPWNAYHVGPGFRGEPHQPPQPVYNTYRPSPHVTQYAYPRSPPRYSYNSRPGDHYSGGFRDEPPQPQPQPQPQPVYATHRYNTYKPSPPRYSYGSRPDHYSGSGFRDEPPQPQPQPHPQPPPQPQPVYATHSYNTYKPSPFVTGYAYPHSPPKHSPYSRPDNNGGPGLRGEGEPSQPPEPLYATNNHNLYKPSPYVSEYAYPESSPRYLSYSIPETYSRDYYSGNHENGNVTSMFSEENPNACRIV